MSNSSYRSARRVRGLASIALILAIGLSLQLAQAGLDEGSFDMKQKPTGLAKAWMWCPNSTSDGEGYHYVAYLDSFQHSGPANPIVTNTVTYNAGSGHPSLQAFITWIVATNSHVQSSQDLTIMRHDVTTVTLP